MAKLRKRQRRKGEVATRRESIRNHCMECMGYQMAEIHECTATSCWLYPWRLGSIDRNWLKKEREEAKAEKKRDKLLGKVKEEEPDEEEDIIEKEPSV